MEIRLRWRPHWQRVLRFPLVLAAHYRIRRHGNSVLGSVRAAWALAALTLSGGGMTMDVVGQVAKNGVEVEVLMGYIPPPAPVKQATCSYCGCRLNLSAATCPQCGAPTKGK